MTVVNCDVCNLGVIAANLAAHKLTIRCTNIANGIKKESLPARITCEVCNISVTRGGISGHRKTKKHLENL